MVVGFHPPYPLAALPVQNVGLGKSPHALKLIHELLVTAELVGVQEAHQGLGLHPPVLFAHQVVGLQLVAQASVGVEALGSGYGHGQRQVLKASNKRVVVQHLGGFEQQPSGLNVVAIRDDIRLRLPVFVEK